LTPRPSIVIGGRLKRFRNNNMTFNYSLNLLKQNKKLALGIKANDAPHAQAQAQDISRSLKVDKIELTYGPAKESRLSEIFRRLAFSDFNYKKCCLWEGSFLHNVPVTYAFGCRYYLRPLILDYMDMNRDNFVKTTCGDKHCINPYHNAYKTNKASKLTGGDLQMVVAYRSQGVGIAQIASALNVHRSTIYRNLKNECLHLRPSSHGGS